MKINFKPDVIVVWPRNCDYPLWRKFIRKDRERFSEVVIVFMETNHGYDYRQFVREQLSDICTIVESPAYERGDWRDVAVNHGLNITKSEWVWFTEQDFLPLNNFWDWIYESKRDKFEIIGVYNGKRLHPCCIFAKRSLVNKTARNFSANGTVDHFGVFQQNIDDLNIPVGMVFEDQYYHMNGLSHNFNLMCDGQPITYMPEEYKTYICNCLKARVPLEPHFINVCTKYLQTNTI